MNLSRFKPNQMSPSNVLNDDVAGSKLNPSFAPKVTYFKFAKIFGKIPPKQVAITLVIVAVVVVGVLIVLSQSGSSESFKQNVVVETPINKTFEFPVADQDGNPTDISVVMNLTSVAKMKDILIQGKPATARQGKIFLIVNLELINDFRQELTISPVNLMRLVDATGKKFAPDVHNEEVVVEPISVKKTRVGFVVDETASGFQLQVGEVDGPKETISLAI